MNLTASKVEIHYFFKDNTHYMDAFIRNKCEHELLEIIRQINVFFGLEVEVDSEAYLEGGLTEWISITVKKHPIIAQIIIAIFINVISNYLTTDKELVELQKQELKLSIEKLKSELKDISYNSIDSNYNDISKVLNNDAKIRKHKSNYYEHLYNCHKITKIESTPLSSRNEKLSEPRVVLRNEFQKYIMVTDDLESQLDEEAKIEIISPVLKKGKFTWKGLYKGEVIDFYMKDQHFKEAVISDKESFINGTYIECVLEICRKINNLGEIKNSGYTVLTVIKKDDGAASILTKQGKLYKAAQEEKKRQLTLNLYNEK